MIIKNLIDEDFVNYKLPSMYIGFPKCNFKCEKECGKRVCQNGILATSHNIDIELDEIISRYMSNFITSAIVIAGLEPFDSFDDLYELVKHIRNCTEDDIVIYTGYYNYEIIDMLQELSQYKNIIVKFGRYIPDQQLHYDEVLGVNLASDNQYAVKIS
jgi:organic radical activating enzyme